VENKVDLSKFSNRWYNPGNTIKRSLWYIVNILFFKTSLPYPNSIKINLLKLFGSKVSNGLILKPCVNIKYPWKLEIGENSWIGENAWIDNLDTIVLGNNVCISQGVYLCTGNHDYKSSTFDLIVKPIVIEDGVWVGAKAIICPGVTLKSHSVISAGSIITTDTEPYGIYKSFETILTKYREISKEKE